MTTPPVGSTSLGRRAELLVERFPDQEAMFFEGTWHRSHELAARSRRAARGLVDLGVQPGDRVAVCMANCPEVAITYSACWRAGAVPTPAMFLLTETELAHVVKDSGARVVVTTPEFLAKCQAAAPGLPMVVVGDVEAPGVVPFTALESGDELPLVDRRADDMAALLYTGGTTGRSKGVALTHASLDAAGAAAVASQHVPGRTRSLLPLPLAHVYGLMLNVSGLHAVEPGRSVLMRWFDPLECVRLIEEHRVQLVALVPSMIAMLLQAPLEDYDLSCLERVGSGGAPLAPEIAREFERRVPSAQVREGYGCTESSALISAQPPEERRLGSVGKPLPGVEVRITGADGEALPPGEDGEICVRGPVVMQGYWNSPEATAQTLRDGWLHTGDVGHLDSDGYLYVVDRLKDLVIRGGFNVYPRDVEDALLAHPEITAAAVVGRPDPKLGEEVVAVVSVAPGSQLSPQDVIEHSRSVVGAHKYPREVRIVDRIPLTSVLKTDRKAVRELIAQRPQ